MSNRLPDLLVRITDHSESAFELSDDIEEVSTDIGTIADDSARDVHFNQLLTALADRCRVQQEFLQELMDMDLISYIWNHCCPTRPDPVAVRTVSLPSREVRLLLGSLGVLEGFLQEFHRYQASDPALQSISDLVDTIRALIIGCSENKARCIRVVKFLPSLVETIYTQLEPSGSPRWDLLRLVLSVISEDDRVSKNPAPVFAREQLVEGELFEKLRRILNRCVEESTSDPTDTVSRSCCIIGIVRELSVSPSVSRQLACDDGLLDFTRSLMAREPSSADAVIRECCKYIRQLSFSDDLKPTVQEKVFTPDIMSKWIQVARSDKSVSANFFGTLANLCLKSPTLALDTVRQYPTITRLVEKVLSTGSVNERIQCMQFLRILVKIREGHDFLSIFKDNLSAALKANSDPTVRRISDEIIHKLDSANIANQGDCLSE